MTLTDHFKDYLAWKAGGAYIPWPARPKQGRSAMGLMKADED